jgi:N-terminal domain on NACHT_NTPase and P-loop NTPases/NB-ARC domain
MAEAVAAISLVASILQLVDFGFKLVGRLNAFSTTTKEVPETFRSISVQLPLAIATLERLRNGIEKDELAKAEAEALKALVDSSVDLVKDLDHILERLMPPKTSSPLEKQLLAIRSLRHDKKVHNASVQLLQNVHLIIFHQSAHIHDITKDLSRAISAASRAQSGCATNVSHGLNLGYAPRLADGTFVGREAEMSQLGGLLDPGSQRQNVVAVVGMGGIGKTQLCIEYAISHQERYSSVFWLNAQDESSLRADLLSMCQILLPDQEGSLRTRAEENGLIQRIRRWFSHPENRSWLLIFDNFDNPKIPGSEDPSSYEIRDYFPQRLQGSVLLTTRSRKITFARQLPLQKFETVEQGLEILSGRSGRSFTHGQYMCIRIISVECQACSDFANHQILMRSTWSNDLTDCPWH